MLTQQLETTAAGRAVLDDATAAAQRDTLEAAGRSASPLPPASSARINADYWDAETAGIVSAMRAELASLRLQMAATKAGPTLVDLRDLYTTTRAAGAVFGTTSEPTGHARAGSDVESKIEITGAKLSITAQATAAWGECALWYPQAITRYSGKVLRATVNLSTLEQCVPLALTSTLSGDFTAWTNLVHGFYVDAAGGDLYVVNNGALGPKVATLAGSTAYDLAIVLWGTSGAGYFIRGGAYTKWTLLLVATTGNTSTLYIVTSNMLAAYTLDNVWSDDLLVAIQPRVSDGYTGPAGASLDGRRTDGQGHLTEDPNGSGGGGLVYVAPNWALDGAGGAVNTPTLGAEGFTDPGLEAAYTAGLCDSLTLNATGTPNEITVGMHGGTKAQEFTAVAQGDAIAQALTLTVNKWYQVSVWGKRTAGSKGTCRPQIYSGAAWKNGSYWNNAAYEQRVITVLIDGAAPHPFRLMTDDFGPEYDTVVMDDASAKEILIADLISSVQPGIRDIYLSAGVTLDAESNVAGVIGNMDSDTDPANFLLATVEKRTATYYARLYKCVAGVYSEVKSGTVTYVAGASPAYWYDGSTVKLLYNEIQVSTNGTVADGTIANGGTYCGKFSSSAGNVLGKLVMRPVGVNGVYEESLNQFS